MAAPFGARPGRSPARILHPVPSTWSPQDLEAGSRNRRGGYRPASRVSARLVKPFFSAGRPAWVRSLLLEWPRGNDGGQLDPDTSEIDLPDGFDGAGRRLYSRLQSDCCCGPDHCHRDEPSHCKLLPTALPLTAPPVCHSFPRRLAGVKKVRPGV